VDYQEERKQIRRIERLARKEKKRMSRLEKELLSKIPSSLVPGNVGNYYDVAWPFTYTINFDFGANPTYGPLTNQTQSFQVTQEAAFILGGITRKCYSGTTSGEHAPLQLIIRDRQSTRQFMDLPIPLQAIAKKTPPTLWEVPLIIMPNAFIDVTITSFNSNPQATVGSGKINLSFIGYRTRTSDISKVLSTVYGG
jgi:hypothetical protein